MSKIPLYNALKNYISSNIIHFDVPGHKSNPKGIISDFMLKKIIDLDVSSSKPIDSLDSPFGVIKKACNLMAKAFHSDYSFFMTNGTTSAVQNMIIANLNPNDKIILPRNIHKSVINGLISSGANPIYINPEYDEEFKMFHALDIKKIKKTINKNKNIKAILVNNPTYNGVVSNIEKIISIARKNKIITLFDEAHGTHFYFNENFPIGSMQIGADMSSISMHKTGGSLTQSSVLLCNKKFIDMQKIKQTIRLSQTTSPSYILLTSLDVARYFLELKGKYLLEKAIELSNYAKKKIDSITGYRTIKKKIHKYNVDETRLTIKVSDIGLTGIKVYDILRDEYNIQIELGDIHTIIIIITIFDTKEKINKLIYALKDIKKKYKKNIKIESPFLYFNNEIIINPRDAFYSKKKSILLKDSIGKISGESIMAYPPGIPIVILGEKITKEIVDHIKFLKKHKCFLTGIDDLNIKNIYVID